MGKANLKLVSPASENRAVGLRSPTNKEMRPKEYLIKPEIGRIIKADKTNRHGLRDSTMILIGYTHGLRVVRVNRLAVVRCQLRGRHAAHPQGYGLPEPTVNLKWAAG